MRYLKAMALKSLILHDSIALSYIATLDLSSTKDLSVLSLASNQLPEATCALTLQSCRNSSTTTTPRLRYDWWLICTLQSNATRWLYLDNLTRLVVQARLRNGNLTMDDWSERCEHRYPPHARWGAVKLWKTTRRQLQRRSKLRLSCWSSHSLTQTSLRYFQTNCCLRVPSLEECQIIIYQLLYRHGTPETHWENCFFNPYDPYDRLTTLIIRLDDANEHAMPRSFSRLRYLQHLSFTGKGIIIHTQHEVSRCRAFLAYEVSASTRVPEVHFGAIESSG